MVKFLNCFIVSFFMLVMFPDISHAQISADSIKEDNHQQKKHSNVEEAIATAGQIENKTIQKEDEILHPWREALGFELNMQKLRSFIIAGRAIEKINRKWDVLIAGAVEDELAIEYQKELTEESAIAIEQVPDITLEEYEAMYALNLKDDAFSMLVRALHSQIYDDNL